MDIRLPLADLRDWSAGILQWAGVPEDDAGVTAGLLLRADARGSRTHGVTRLASYVAKLRSGEYRARPAMRLDEGPGVLTVDGDGAMGQVAAQRALEHGLAMLERQPTVVCRLRQCGHLGAVGLYALAAAEAGAVAIVAQRTPPLLSLPGYAGPVIGNNPLAFAAPVAGGAPLMVDMASSVAARGHILLHARAKEPLPEGWALDARGEPTTDAEAALDGSLMPAGGHKGMALSMLVELLAGALSASPQSVRAVAAEGRVGREGAVGGQSAFMLLMNPRLLSGDEDLPEAGGLVGAYLRHWLGAYESRAGAQARIPGQKGSRLEAQACDQGIPLTPELFAELSALGQQAGLALPARMN